jgi:hypothetical protein
LAASEYSQSQNLPGLHLKARSNTVSEVVRPDGTDGYTSSEFPEWTVSLQESPKADWKDSILKGKKPK